MRLRILSLVACAALISCAIAVERAQVRLSPDLRTGYSATIKGSMFDKDQMNSMKSALAGCGMQVRRYFNSEGDAFLSVTLADVSPEAIDSYLPCVPFDGQFQVEPVLEEGWLYNYYKLNFTLIVPRCVLTREQDRVNVESSPSASIFPHVTRLMLPGEIYESSVHETVRILGFSRETGNGWVIVRSDGIRSETGPSRDERHAYCQRFVPQFTGQFRQKFEEDRLTILARSRVAKFDLNTALAILGIIAGSGVMVELFRRAFLRRVKDQVSR